MKSANILIFDMDGVIADTEPLKFKAYWQAYKELFDVDIKDGAWRMGLREEAAVRGHLERSIKGVKKSMVQGLSDKQNNRIKELFGNHKDQILSALEKDNIPDCMIPIVGKLKREKYAALLDLDLKPISGAVEFIKYASGPYRLAVATGSAKTEADRILTKFGIKKCFSIIITKDDIGTGKGKPLPDIYLECLKKLDAKPQNCLVIEDSIAGIQSAIAANLRVIAIATTTPKEKLMDAGAACVVNGFEELKNISRTNIILRAL